MEKTEHCAVIGGAVHDEAQLLRARVLHSELCDKIRKELDATTLYYNTISDLIRSIGLNREELCMGSLTEIYPQIDWTQMESEW